MGASSGLSALIHLGSSSKSFHSSIWIFWPCILQCLSSKSSSHYQSFHLSCRLFTLQIYLQLGLEEQAGIHYSHRELCYVNCSAVHTLNQLPPKALA